MKFFLAILFAALSFAASSQGAAVGDVQLGVKSSAGPLEPVWITKTANRALGWNSSGVLGPISISGGSGSSDWPDITNTPTTLAGYGITDSITAALAASTYQPLIGTGTLALSKLATDPLARANHTGTQAWSTITSTPTTLAGYGITDSITAALAASTYQPLIADGGLAIAKTSGLQTALDGKLSTATAASTYQPLIADGALTIAKTSGLQTALDGKQATSANLATYSGIAPSANVQTLLGAANYAAFKASLSLGDVENTALSTWAGSTNLTTLGTVTAGTWNASIIAPAYLGTGASISAKFLRGDGTWQTVSATGGTWGTITGTLADQTDLQTALNAKLSTATAASTYQPLIADGALTIAKTSGLQTALDAKLTGPANAAGLLTNNGSGTLSYTATSTGGNGTDDGGKIAKFNSLGQIAGGFVGSFEAGPSYDFVAMDEGLFIGSETNSGRFGVPVAGGTNLVWTVPSVTGTLVSTGDTGSVTNTMLAGSIALTKLAQSSASTGQVIKWNGSAWAPATLGSMALQSDSNVAVSGGSITGLGTFSVLNSGTGAHNFQINHVGTLTAGRTLTCNVNDADRSISLSGNLTVPSAATVSGTNTGDQTITLTGDVTGSGTGSFAATLANTAVAAGTYGTATAGVAVTVDAKGRLTNATTNTITPAESSVTFTDITTNDATTSKHGYLPKLPGGTTTYLRADGAFATPSGGGGTGGNWVLISTTTISGSPTTLDFTLSGAYRQYRLELDNVYQNADGITISIQTSTDGGATFDNGVSDYNFARGVTTGYAPTSATASAVQIHPGGSSDAAEGITGWVEFFDPLSTSRPTMMNWRLYNAFWNGGAMQLIEGAGRRNTSNDVNAVRILTATSTFAGGKVRLFGWSE